MKHRQRIRLDGIDRKLLNLVQQDSARPLVALGDAVGLSPSAVQRRLKRYRATGLIRREMVVLDTDTLPETMLACVLVSLDRESRRLHDAFQDRMRSSPEVQQCYDVSGDWDYLVIMVTEGMAHCRGLLDELFLEAPNIRRYTTLFVYDRVKVGLQVPLRNIRP